MERERNGETEREGERERERENVREKGRVRERRQEGGGYRWSIGSMCTTTSME